MSGDFLSPRAKPSVLLQERRLTRWAFFRSSKVQRSAQCSQSLSRNHLGDAESSLGDAKSLLGDVKSSLGDAKSSLGDAKSLLGDAKSLLDIIPRTLNEKCC
jgi:hypothetical protein